MRYFAFVVLLFVPALAGAHSGGMDRQGCHTQSSTGEKHCHYSPQQAKLTVGYYYADVLRVIDGDTFRARITTLPSQFTEMTVRIRDIDAPELSRPKCTSERHKAEEAREALAALLREKVILGKVDFGKYGGRLVANVYDTDNRDIAAELVRKGLVRQYLQGARKSWC